MEATLEGISGAAKSIAIGASGDDGEANAPGEDVSPVPEGSVEDPDRMTVLESKEMIAKLVDIPIERMPQDEFDLRHLLKENMDKIVDKLTTVKVLTPKPNA